LFNDNVDDDVDAGNGVLATPLRLDAGDVCTDVIDDPSPVGDDITVVDGVVIANVALSVVLPCCGCDEEGANVGGGNDVGAS
jgi:hypothetical protein